MRRNPKSQNPEIVVNAATVPVREAWVFSTGLFGILLILLFAGRTAIAEPSAFASIQSVGAIQADAVQLDAVPNAPSPVVQKVASPVDEPVSRSLDSLLDIPGLTLFRSKAEITDESIAAAVNRGTNPDLKRLSGFRKKSTDLFNTERQVEIGNQELLVRLRVRAKARKAMSVEVKF
jgi:hypothetical protein